MTICLVSKTPVEHDGEIIHVDKQLLFQRLLTIAGRDRLELKSSLNYELSIFPASIFDKDGLMRTANKPALADALWKIAGKGAPVLPSGLKFVLDGGSLLLKKVWKKGESFQVICQRYVDYVLSNYGADTEVVFDGYPMELTTKDTTHLKGTKGKKARLVKFSLNSKLCMTKDKFLLNKENKQT